MRKKEIADVQIRIYKSTHKKLRVMAAKRGMTIAEVVNSLAI